VLVGWRPSRCRHTGRERLCSAVDGRKMTIDRAGEGQNLAGLLEMIRQSRDGTSVECGAWDQLVPVPERVSTDRNPQRRHEQSTAKSSNSESGRNRAER